MRRPGAAAVALALLMLLAAVQPPRRRRTDAAPAAARAEGEVSSEMSASFFWPLAVLLVIAILVRYVWYT
ncbi:MAG: hypothetical protein AB1640_10300 [bacterium]